MKRKFLLIVAFCYFICLLSCFVCANDNGEVIIEGRVICEDDIDLGNIKFEIDSVSASGDHHLSSEVYTDKDGKLSFCHPGGDRFYCVIYVDSLPFGYGSKQLGISEKSTYYEENGIVFELSPIDSISVSYSDGGVSYSVCDKNGDRIFCKTEITRDESESFENITYEELKQLAEFPRSGYIAAGEKIVKWSGHDSIGADPVDMKMGMLYNEGSISKDKYYDLLLDYIEDDYDGAEFLCGNPIISMKNEIRDYANQTTDAKLRDRIISVLGASDEYVSILSGDPEPESEIIPESEAISGQNNVSDGENDPHIYVVVIISLAVLMIFVGLRIFFHKKLKN